MSESQHDEQTPDGDVTGEHTGRRTGDQNECRRCGRKQGLVGKYDINLCRQCFREVARSMGFKKYR
ncbi:30S ribosomal protein S14 [Halobium palmae]|uniref:Small ribosomal subunit protein uS14 n=1 Tax=Halobium palmae TaxID=1776492 RepID=A0ABD5RXN3_9EURY